MKIYRLKEGSWRHSLIYSLLCQQSLNRKTISKVTGFNYSRTVRDLLEDLLSDSLIEKTGQRYYSLPATPEQLQYLRKSFSREKHYSRYVYFKLQKMEDQDLAEAYLLCMMKGLARQKDLLEGYSLSAIANMSSMSRVTVKRHLDALSDRGIIAWSTKTVGEVFGQKFVSEDGFRCRFIDPIREWYAKYDGVKLSTFSSEDNYDDWERIRINHWLVNLSFNGKKVFTPKQITCQAYPAVIEAYRRRCGKSADLLLSLFVDYVIDHVRNLIPQCRLDSARANYVIGAIMQIR